MICTLTAILTAAVPSALAAPPSVVTQGDGAAIACEGCHGIDGAGNAQAGFPVLAHLPQTYFTKQIADFKSGKRSNPVMTPIAQALSDKDAELAASYYAGLVRPNIQPDMSADPAVIALGENLAINGDWNRLAPPCLKCHAADGLGVAPAFPPIAGQHASYIVSQLQAWKSGSRTNDPQSLMKSAVQNLTDDEMNAVAEYFANTEPAKIAGNSVSLISAGSKPIKAAGDSKISAPTQFAPPPEAEIPNNEFGEMVLMGKNIFTHTGQYAKGYVGNGLNCANCHIDNGRKADSAPLWAAYVLYPAYRKKTGLVDTMQSRIQGCFRFSMNGKVPAADSKEITALVTYSYWLASGAPTGTRLPGQGFGKIAKPGQTPDLVRGSEVFKNNCALCHGADGQGTKANGVYAFPPLWGKDSYNWGAGMHRIDTAASFIKNNMPFGRGGSLSDQEAWDVALFMNSHDRPKDPRFEKSITKTRDKFHDENCLYGRTPGELAAYLEKQDKTKAGQSKAPLQKGFSPALSQ
jgi:thiosulfate dehydrogenase